MPATEVVIDPVNQLKDLLILQPCHSLNLRWPPRILVDPHKSREYRKVAVAHISDMPHNRGLLNNALGLHLSDNGEDVGRLVAATNDARAELATIIAGRDDAQTGDRVRHGMALFRARGATEHDKHSGILVLAGILEERRQLLKDHLVKKDEGALFEIANNFAIRHRNENQRADYDPIFLDWIFWWYLATIELSDRLSTRSTPPADEASPF